MNTAKIIFGNEIGHSYGEIKDFISDSVPLLLFDVNEEEKNIIGIPISHGGYSSDSKLFDTSKDINNATYFRAINVPAPKKTFRTSMEYRNSSVVKLSFVTNVEGELSNMEDVLRKVNEYLKYCGGPVNVAAFWDFLSLTDSKIFPEKGAVSRKYIETVFLKGITDVRPKFPY